MVIDVVVFHQVRLILDRWTIEYDYLSFIGVAAHHGAGFFCHTEIGAQTSTLLAIVDIRCRLDFRRYGHSPTI